MSIHRRTVILGLPFAASALLTACGGSEDQSDAQGNLSANDTGRASAQAVGSAATSGSLTVNHVVSGSWPTELTPMKPTDTLVQAVLNGNDMHISINHVSGTATRTVSVVLRKTSAWADNMAYAFAVTGGPHGTVEGLFTHFSATSSTATKMFYKIASGGITATKSGDFVTLVFSPSSTTSIVATKAAIASTSKNDAPSNGQITVKYSTSASARTLKINLKTETETSV